MSSKENHFCVAGTDPELVIGQWSGGWGNPPPSKLCPAELQKANPLLGWRLPGDEQRPGFAELPTSVMQCPWLGGSGQESSLRPGIWPRNLAPSHIQLYALGCPGLGTLLIGHCGLLVSNYNCCCCCCCCCCYFPARNFCLQASRLSLWA
ncbi:hypothetical protein HJG60_010779 [Phyllostomus discolor]|uniref:Uncharacterized protein n=1 Tax=Phyllostomus discolor TaxID=89673 RepID=A0A834EA93_9CHIR|nr:hypothetical protein HJG60_010779 [Phyllostomus discolor]